MLQMEDHVLWNDLSWDILFDAAEGSDFAAARAFESTWYLLGFEMEVADAHGNGGHAAANSSKVDLQGPCLEMSDHTRRGVCEDFHASKPKKLMQRPTINRDYVHLWKHKPSKQRWRYKLDFWGEFQVDVVHVDTRLTKTPSGRRRLF